jgi:hypothetical protein
MRKTYTELSQLKTFMERFEYLKLKGVVGDPTFMHDRFLNQDLYQKNPRWKRARREVILRDNGCDLGIEGYGIFEHIIVHHMNPITAEDILGEVSDVYNPEFLICVSPRTHNAIHFGDASQLPRDPVIRRPGDTKLW